MVYIWDSNKPESTNERTWRRQQVKQYLKLNPNAKPKDVHDWIQAQTPNQWPSCDRKYLAKIIGRLRKSTDKYGLSLSPMILYDECKPLTIQWD